MLLLYLVFRAGPATIYQNAKSIGWGLALVIGLGGVSHLLKTWAWRLTLSGETDNLSFTRMFGLRLVSEAIGQLGLPGQVAGEATRVVLLGSDVPLPSRILSVTLDRGLYVATGAAVTIAGISIGLLMLSLSHALRVYAALFAISLLCLIGVTVWAIGQRWRLLSSPALALGKLPGFGKWILSKEAVIHSVEQKLLEFHRKQPSAFWGSLALNFVCQAFAVLEVYLILLFMGTHVRLIGALILEALTKLINLIGAFNPGNIGTYEGGTVVVASLLGLPGPAGLTLGLCRRARGLFWGAVGGLCFFLLSRAAHRSQTSSGSDAPVQNGEIPLQGPPPRAQCESFPESTAAIIFANESGDARGFVPELARVGTIPVILRAILGVENTRVGRIIVLANPATGDSIRKELVQTRRLPENVEWVEQGAASPTLPHLLGDLAARSKKIVLIRGNRTYHPRLHQMVSEWDGREGALALTSGDQFDGVYALSQEVALDVSRTCFEPLETPEELYNWLKPKHGVLLKPVEGSLWQLVDSPRDRLIAERKLDTWLVKPTDGKFARMNRRISIPISRQVIKFPITPNMVTLFTLGVSFAAGVFFALGGYWNIVFGALLSVWASILDGCDGEVARLKLQVTKFGCWLETVCDYLYYLFIFAGMSIGFARTQGTKAYLMWGGVFLFGAVASFLAVGFARHRLASSNPERFLDLWQKKADKQQSNWLMYVARNTEFVIRRCFLPYALLAFALLNVLRIAFIASAIGANLVWLIALYSTWILSAKRRPLPSDPAASRVREGISA
jgi:uncharacterized protein (TIRG00374 family)